MLISSQPHVQHHIDSVKLAMIGVFIPQKPANTKNQDFFLFPRELTYQYTTAQMPPLTLSAINHKDFPS